MAVTVTNPEAIFQPVVDEIQAQTEFMSAQAACAYQAQVDIANATICAAPTAADLQAQAEEELCCTTEELMDTPEEGDTTIRETCSNGKVTDTVTYANGDTCTFVVSGAAPQNGFLACDENGNECLTGQSNMCKERKPGEPYPAYFIPLASDFGNPIFCVPGFKYAFAWTGVDSKNLKEQLDTLGDVDLNDPNNKYVAVKNGGPYACGPRPADSEQLNALDPAGQDGSGNDYYCFSGIPIAHTVDDITAIGPTTEAFDADGNNIPCDGYELDELQFNQSNKLNGCYAAFGSLCPEWDGIGATTSGGGGEIPADPTSSFWEDLFCQESATPVDISNKTAQSAYYTLWKDWWECEKRSKCLQQRIYALQLPFALYGLTESIGLYNDITDKQLAMICNAQEDMELVAACSAQILGTADSPGLLKECQANLLEGHNDRIGTINNRGVQGCEMADNEMDCYDQLWKPLQLLHASPMASELQTMLQNTKFTSERMRSWADNLDECLSLHVLPELKNQFNCFLTPGNCVANNLNDWREELKAKAFDLHDHFNRVYKENETTMIPAIMDMTTCLVQRACELRDWLVECAKKDQCVYQEGYQYGEVAQARAAMATSAEAIPKATESLRWLETNIPYALDIFKTCFGDDQRTFNQRVYCEASELAPELRRCYEFFLENACDYKDFFDRCYKDEECRLVKQQIDMACRLANALEESLREVREWAWQDRYMYDENFRHCEIEALGTTADLGTLASEELHDFNHWMDERSREFYNIYCSNWLQCDLDNIKEHCDIWNRVNPLMKIERNNENLDELSHDLQEVTSLGLIHAESYIDKVFAEQERFDLCTEDPAALYVRKRVSAAIEELERCTSRYATGHLLAAKQLLKSEGARQEGGAVESARRWNWWANEQLDDKDFRRRFAIMELMDRYANTTISAHRAETEGQDLLLQHAREALIRGHVYLNNMQESSRSTFNMYQSQVDTLMRTVQLWHFWPELALRESNEFHTQVLSLLDDAQNFVQTGHYWTDMASSEKNSGVNVLTQSLEFAMRLNQLGQFYFSQAEQLNAQRSQTAVQVGQLGNAYAQTGHNLHRLASDKMTNALSQSIQGAQAGLGASEIGHQHNATALEIENKMTLNALEHLKASMNFYAVGLDFLQELRQSYELTGSYGANAGQNMLNLFRHAQENGKFSGALNESCYEMQYQMLCKAKDYLQRNHQINMQALHGQGVLGATNNFLSQQGQNVGSAFSLLGNSLQGLATNSTPLPFFAASGGGNGAFGFNGGAF